MDKNKPKKAVIGESKVMHVAPGFAIPVIILFLSLLLVFSAGWFGVSVLDAVTDNVVNPIIKQIDPDADEIDIMEIFNPPTSETLASKKYAEFPTLYDEAAFKNLSDVMGAFPTQKFAEAERTFIEGMAFLEKGYYAASAEGVGAVASWATSSIPEAVETYGLSAAKTFMIGGADVFSWGANDLTAAIENVINSTSDRIQNYPAKMEAWYNDHLPFRSIIFNANESITNQIEANYGDVQNNIAQTIMRAQSAYDVLLGNKEASDGVNNGGGNQNNHLNNEGVGAGEDLVDEESEDEDEIHGDPDNLGKDPDEEDVQSPSGSNESDTQEPETEAPTETDGEEIFETGETETDGEEVFETDETETDGEEVFVTDPEETAPPSDDYEDGEDETLPVYDENEEDDGSCQHEYVDKGYEVEPTCTEFGLAVKECSLCGRVEKYYVAKEHEKNGGTVIKPATCSEFGRIEYNCTNCGKLLSSEAIDKAEHKKDEEGKEVKPSTCTESGLMEYRCLVCDALISTKTLAKLDHVKDEEGKVAKPSTCAESGLMEYRCVNCDELISTKTLAKLPHEKDGGTITRDATCKEEGLITYCCTVCGAEMGSEKIPKTTDHEYIVISKTDALTCGCRSKEVYECKVCGNQYSKTTVKKHVAGETIETVEPSFTSYGYTLIRCIDCGGEYRTNRKNKIYDTEYALPINRSDSVMEGRSKWLFYRGNNSEAYYCGTNLMTEAELAEYVSVMTTLNELCKERGITLQICIWPNKDQVYPEYVTWVPQTQEKRVDLLVDYVQKNSDVNIIYPIENLKNTKSYYDVYFQYDTHWNNAGGFVGYQAMLEALGLQTTSITNMPVYKFTGKAGSGPNTDPYLGPIADMIGLGKLDAKNYTGNYNYYVKYRPEVQVDTFEGKNGAGDYRHTTAANAPNDLNFVMLADSYRVMQLSYLEKDFTDCTLAHRDQIDQNHAVNDSQNYNKTKDAIKNADVLVLASVERLEPDILSTAKEIIAILQEE